MRITPIPIIVLPSLAKRAGLHEAILLQALYLLQARGFRVHEDEDYAWVSLTYNDWAKVLPFWSPTQIRRIAKRAGEANLIDSKIMYSALENTKWYRVCTSMLLPAEMDELELMARSFRGGRSQ